MKTIHVSIQKKTRLARYLVWCVAVMTRGDKGMIHTTILGRTIYTTHPEFPAWLRNHELIHFCQIRAVGRIRWAWRYYVTDRSVPYREKTAEKEAYAHQHDPSYLRRRWPNLQLIVEDA